MTRLQLNKSSLARETASLQGYRRFLPSLDLKRQQLMTERANAQRLAAGTSADIDELMQRVARQLPMLADKDIDLSELVTVNGVTLETENVVGTRLPVLAAVDIRVRRYALLAKPHWVDNVAALLGTMLELKLQLQVQRQRVERLDAAVKTITQRVNLFDKVLIPRAQANIKRIRIYLSDEEMAAVVRSKIAKRKHAAAARS